jgi:hypothetical protein
MSHADYTVQITCDCAYCERHATRTGKSFPLVAFIRPETAAATGKGKQARHGIVSTVHEPFFADAAARMEAERGILPLGVQSNA